MIVKLAISIATLFVTTFIMSFVYEGEWGFSFVENFFSAKNSMRYPFLIHFLFVSHFVLATYYFFRLRKKVSTTDFKRLLVALGLGVFFYGSYVNIASTSGKNVFSIIRYQMGYFHIFYDELKLFFRLNTGSSKPFFIGAGFTLIAIFILSLLLFFGTSLVILFKIVAGVLLGLVVVSALLRAKKTFNKPYFIFVMGFFSAPLFLIQDAVTFEKLGIFYFCYHVIQCYLYFPASQFLQGFRSGFSPVLKFAGVVLTIHSLYLALGYLGVQNAIIPFAGDMILSEAFFSENWMISAESFLNYPFILFFDVHAYKFWGAFHIIHCFFYDRLLLRGYFELV